MAQGFYELLGVSPSAPTDEVRAAYQRRLAELVRRLRTARAQGADVSILEGHERVLREAVEILCDPLRRRRYDAFRRLSAGDLPTDAEQLWQRGKAALVDPATVAALQVVRALTDLPLGDPLGEGLKGKEAEAPAPPPPQVPPAPAPAEVSPQEEPDTLDDAFFGAVVSLPMPARPAPAPEPAAAVASGPEPFQRLVDRYGYDGRLLKTVRASKGIDLDTLARHTRISRRHLEAIEQNAFEDLPATIFVRGYVKEIARVLEITDGGVVDGYLALLSQHRG